jgi:hypothetical protein
VQVEGSCSGRHGFIITVTEVLSVGKGKIREGAPRSPSRAVACSVLPLGSTHATRRSGTGAGLVTFPMRYMAVVFRPFKGEVLDAVVTTVNKMGFFAEVGPLQVLRPPYPTSPTSPNLRGRCRRASPGPHRPRAPARATTLGRAYAREAPRPGAEPG